VKLKGNSILWRWWWVICILSMWNTSGVVFLHGEDNLGGIYLKTKQGWMRIRGLQISAIIFWSWKLAQWWMFQVCETWHNVFVEVLLMTCFCVGAKSCLKCRKNVIKHVFLMETIFCRSWQNRQRWFQVRIITLFSPFCTSFMWMSLESVTRNRKILLSNSALPVP